LSTTRRLAGALGALVAVLVVGSVGYRLLGLGWLDAVYQTVTTVTTIGFREVEPFDDAAKVFTIVLVMAGVGTVLYTLGVLFELVLEGHVATMLGRRRMDRRIAGLSGHVVLCGWGRVGRSIARHLTQLGKVIVVVDADPDRLPPAGPPTVLGDATDDAVLRAAGIERASSLVTALASDADNLFVALSGRALNPGLFIVARARDDSAVEKLTRAGADRVVNPQEIGGARMAAFVAQPHVASFVDVVMHERPLGFRLEEIAVSTRSPLAGRLIGQLPGGAQLLAVRRADGTFVTRPDPSSTVQPGQVLIVVGTEDELAALTAAA
jgi:voltage-gated potassium channel